MNQKGFAPIFILVGILIIAGLVAGAYYFGKMGKSGVTQTQQNQSINSQQNLSNKEFQLSGSEVLRVINGQKTVLFKNVEGVSEVRLGPDGKTLHFKPSGKPNPSQQYCGNLEEKGRPASSDYTNPPPNQPPWDFKTMGHAYTILGCNGDGYLVNSNYFAYLQLRSSQEGYVVYEDLASGKKNQVQIDASLLYGFSDGSPQKSNSYSSNSIVGKDGYQYYYPHQDAKTGNKLVVALGRLVVAIDVSNSKFIGGKGFGHEDHDFPIIATSFYFLNEKSLPFVVMESRWEGPPIFAGLIDLSGNSFKLVKLAYLDRRPWFDFGVQPITWENDSILFNFTDFEEIKIPEDFLKGKDLATMKDADIDSLSRQLEGILSNQGKYQKIICDLHLGRYSPSCQGLKGIVNYRYSSSQGLVKI